MALVVEINATRLRFVGQDIIAVSFCESRWQWVLPHTWPPSQNFNPTFVTRAVC